MRAIGQRVSSASFAIEGKKETSIGKGLLVFLGIHKMDTDNDVDWIARKIGQLRVFEDENGLMNQSLLALFFIFVFLLVRLSSILLFLSSHLLSLQKF